MDNYSKKMVDSSRYSIVSIKNLDLDKKDLPDSNGSGFVYSKYLPIQVDKLIMDKDLNKNYSSEYDIFMEDYNKKHKYCPKCGSLEYTSSIGYILDRDFIKDLVIHTCKNCGDVHAKHERIESFNK